MGFDVFIEMSAHTLSTHEFFVFVRRYPAVDVGIAGVEADVKFLLLHVVAYTVNVAGNYLCHLHGLLPPLSSEPSGALETGSDEKHPGHMMAYLSREGHDAPAGHQNGCARRD